MKSIFIALLALSPLLYCTSSFGQAATRAAATWQVQSYDLDVSVPQGNSRTVTVKAVLSLKNVSSAPAGTLTLRISPSAEVSAVRINDAVVDLTKGVEKVNASVTLQRIAVRFALVVPGAAITSAVDYRLNLKDNTAVGSATSRDVQFLPLSYWYPTPNSWYFTGGTDTAPVRLKVNAPGMSVVASGTETSGAFDQKLSGQPFFIAGQWELSDQNGTSVYIPAGTGAAGQTRAGELAALFSEAKAFAAGIFGMSPDVRLRMVTSRKGAGFGGSGTVIIDEAVFRRPKLDSQTAMQIAEAAAKLWLGSAVSVKGDGYGTITEGLSRYIATQFIEQRFGKDVADIERLRQRSAYAAVSDRDAPMTTVSPIDDYFYPEVANKGAMAWRILARRVGTDDFSRIVRTSLEDGYVDVPELRAAFSPHKELFEFLFDKVTDTNLMVGLPQAAGDETKVALRNTGGTDVTVDVTATTATGEQVPASATIKAKSFSEIAFKSAAKIIRVEIDTEKLYPQTDYSDDIAPRESTDSDPLLAAKRLFDRQDFVSAEKTARTLLARFPRFDDLRILLARSLLAQNKNAEAEKEFRMVVDEKLPSARSIAWANVGLAETAARSNQNDNALRLVQSAILIDADYGASLAARNLRNRIGGQPVIDSEVKAFFAAFDKSASANRKSEIDAMVIPGEITKFAAGVSGSTEQWQTQVRQVDRVDANTLLVEAVMNIKLLNQPASTGMAVFRLVKAGTDWKLAAVDMFEVR